MTQSRVHVIAEAGSNHNARADWAKRLVTVARDAGADSVKFQFIYPEGLYVPRYVHGDHDAPSPVFERRATEVLSDEAWRDTFRHASQAGIPCTASVFDRRGVDLLLSLSVPYLKVASTDLNNLPLLEVVADTGVPVIVSTGMSTLGEIEQAVDVFRRYGAMERLVLLHCVSVYPCPVELCNLGMITTLKSAFGVPVGYSDHTQGSLASCLAVALGAVWLEKHFTLDRSAPGFDHAHAAEPDALAAYIADVRATEGALERPSAKVSAAEETTKRRARRGLYVSRDLPAGHVLTRDDILIVRPGAPLQPKDLDSVIGQPLASSVRRYEALEGNLSLERASNATWEDANSYWTQEMKEKGI